MSSRHLVLIMSALLAGCSTLAEYGIGGPPVLLCDRSSRAMIDDRIAGSDSARLSVVRRFEDADPMCMR